MNALVRKWLAPGYAYGQTHDILPLQPHPTYLALAKQKTKRREFYPPSLKTPVMTGEECALCYGGCR
jgi:hypothetical protein